MNNSLIRKETNGSESISDKERDDPTCTESSEEHFSDRLLGNIKAFSVVKLQPLHESFCRWSHGPMTLRSLFLSLPGLETHPAQPSIHTTVPAKQEPIDPSLDSEHIYSAVQPCGNGQGGRFLCSSWDNEQEHVSQRCFKLRPLKGTHPDNSELTQTKALFT